MTQGVPPARRPAARPWQPAPLGRRFGALMIDWIACVLVARLLGDPVREPWLPVAIFVAEYGFFVGLFAQTPGMRFTRLRCPGVVDGAPVGVLRALLRGLCLALVVPALIMDGDRRGLHDRLAGTVVVLDAPRP
jgi:uncharacterized RDD family membrane protein YckC